MISIKAPTNAKPINLLQYLTECKVEYLLRRSD